MEPYIGQIMLWGGTFAPVGWLACEGQLLPISQYDTLYSLIGTAYGGDGVTTFALPDMRCRISNSVGQGPGLSNYTIGEVYGTEQNTLTTQNLAMHSHGANAGVKMACCLTDEQDSDSPINCYPRLTPGVNTYAATSNAVMGASTFAVTLGAIGANMPVPNIMPTLYMYYCIATDGVYPSRP